MTKIKTYNQRVDEVMCKTCNACKEDVKEVHKSWKQDVLQKYKEDKTKKCDHKYACCPCSESIKDLKSLFDEGEEAER